MAHAADDPSAALRAGSRFAALYRGMTWLFVHSTLPNTKSPDGAGNTAGASYEKIVGPLNRWDGTATGSRRRRQRGDDKSK
jgi:hypothetical protein